MVPGPTSAYSQTMHKPESVVYQSQTLSFILKPCTTFDVEELVVVFERTTILKGIVQPVLTGVNTKPK